MSNDIDIFVPDAPNQYFFGKFQHAQTIAATSADIPNGKSALDIIKEALIQLGTIPTPTITSTVGSIGYNAASTSTDMVLTGTCENVNASQGVTLTHVYQKSTVETPSQTDDDWTTIETFASVSANSQDTSTQTVTFSAFPDDEQVHFRVKVTDNETNVTKYSSKITYDPTYSAPKILLGHSGGTQGVLLAREDLGGQFEDNDNRQVQNGRSRVQFRIQKNTAGVDLDSYTIEHDGSAISGQYPADASSFLLDTTGIYSTNFNVLVDDGNVTLDTTHTYTVKLFDEKFPEVDGVAAHTVSDSYTVNRLPVKMVASVTELDHTATDAELQAVFNTQNSATARGSSSDTRYVAETTVNSAGSDTTIDLDVELECDGTFTSGKYIYIFIPATYFGYTDGAGGESIVGTGNANIDLIDSDNNSYVLKNSDGTGFTGNAGWLVLNYNAGITVNETGVAAANETQMIVLRLTNSMGASNNGLSFTITNTEV